MNKKPSQQGKGKGGAQQAGAKAGGKGAAAQKGGGAAAAAPGPSVQDLFTKLDGHIKNNELKKALKAADGILAIEPRDVDAYRCKTVAHILEDQHAEALAVIDAAAAAAADVDLKFEKAYCLYKRNSPQAALDVLKEIERTPKVLQLEGQILYRLGNNAECISRYDQLFQQHKVTSAVINANVVAAYTSGGRAGDVKALLTARKASPKDDAALAYNVACALIDREDFEGAEEHLLLARRLEQEASIEDELTEEEMDDRLAPIAVQLAYVMQAQGRGEEALAEYNALLKRKPNDPTSVAVASNNLMSLRGKRDLFDSLKRSDKLFDKAGPAGKLQLAETLQLRMSARQKEALWFNRFLLLLFSHKLDQARELAVSLEESFPDSEMPTLLRASLLLREGQNSSAEALLAGQAMRKPDGFVATHLARAQAAALAGKFAEAADALSSVESLQHQPAVVATLVALWERSGNIKAAASVLDEAVAWWDGHMGEDQGPLELLLQEAAAFHLQNGAHKRAAELFERLTNGSSPSVRTAALTGLVSCAAQFNPTAAEKYESRLPPLPGVASLDAAALERTVSATGASASGRKAERVGDKRGAPPDGADAADRTRPKKKKKKKKGKPLYPKGFDPANPGPPPDPERWLPRRERSTFKAKRKDKKAAAVRGSQGAVSRNASATPEPPPPGPKAGTAPPAVSEVPKGEKSGGGQSAGGKKKKGKR